MLVSCVSIPAAADCTVVVFKAGACAAVAVNVTELLATEAVASAIVVYGV